jgi:hypothetical protein
MNNLTVSIRGQAVDLKVLLEAQGFEVREGVVYDDGAWWTASAIPLRPDRRPSSSCLVVRPKEEATDG